MLRSKLDEINLSFSNLANPNFFGIQAEHIGDAIFVSTGQGLNCVDMRRHFILEGKSFITPTNCGMALSPNQWNSLKEKVVELLALHHVQESALPCIHDAQEEEMMQYWECMPFGWMLMSM